MQNIIKHNVYPVVIPMAEKEDGSALLTKKELMELKAEARQKAQSFRRFVSMLLKEHVRLKQLSLFDNKI